MRYFLLLVMFSSITACTRPAAISSGRWIDLTHTFDDQTIYWPTAEKFQHERGSTGVTEAGYYYEAHAIRLAEHGGTHIDAPIHFHEGRQSVDEIPLRSLMGQAVRVDMTAACEADRDYQITSNDIICWEAQFGKIPEGSIVLLHTGFGRYWPDARKYMGTAERGEDAVAKLHFPGLHPEAATWLATERKIAMVGIDTPSIDYGQSKTFAAHVNLFAHNVPALENVANLDSLPAVIFEVIALPMKIGKGSGGPTRIIARIP